MIVVEPDSQYFILHLEYAGFSNEALKSMDVILDTLKESSEYKNTGAIDMGRFIMVTQNSSWHYYEITGVCKQLSDFKLKYNMNNEKQFMVSNSGVTKEKRLISIHVGKSWKDIAFMAEVGSTDPVTGKIVPSEIEVFDVMKNGQLRFAVYGSDGKLKSGSNSQHSIAGKPSKCMWCHESSVQPLYTDVTDIDGYMTSVEFIEYVERAMKIINSYRKGISTEIDYYNTHQHTYSELNYIGFMNPTLSRVANELQTDLQSAEKKTIDLRQYTFKDFPFYYQKTPEFKDYPGLLYRSQVDSLFDYTPIQIPSDALETNNNEPNFFD